jgi:hypothetical protein
MRVHWYVSRPTPGLLNAGSKGRNTASLPLQLGTNYPYFSNAGAAIYRRSIAIPKPPIASQ